MNHDEGEQALHIRKNVIIAAGFDGQSRGGKLHSPFFVESASSVREAVSQSLTH